MSKWVNEGRNLDTISPYMGFWKLYQKCLVLGG